MSTINSNKSVSREMLSVSEAARRLGLQPCTLRRWIVNRRISVIRLSSRATRVPASEVERILRLSTVPALQPEERRYASA